MKSIPCRLCNSTSHFVFTTTLLKKSIQVFKCSNCSLIQTEEAYWLEEAYRQSISVLDTGIFVRNYEIVKKVLLLLSFKGKKKNLFSRFMEPSFEFQKFERNLLDYGGGHGILVRLLRDIGLNAFWTDKYSSNLYANGFERDESSNYSVLLAFELFEHFADPAMEFEDLFKKQNPDIIIFSTLLYGDSVPESDWWYYSFETGQHIAFYNRKTLEHIAKKYSRFLYTDNSGFHILSKKEIDFESIIAIFNRLDFYFDQVKKLYESYSFSDHLNLKANLSLGID